MKKITIIIITFFLYLTSFAQENNIRVRYIKGLKKVTDTTSKKPSMLKDLYFTLIANGKESVFYYKKGMKITGQEINARFINADGGGGVFYKNIEKNEYLHQDSFQDDLYLINLKEKEWVLTKEKKEINNFLCYKAVSKEVYFDEFMHQERIVNYIAWFTPEISLPFGPTVFNGLPGLVIAAQVDGYYYYADKIEFNLEKTPVIKPQKGIKIHEEEIVKKINELGKKLYQKYHKRQ